MAHDPSGPRGDLRRQRATTCARRGFPGGQDHNDARRFACSDRRWRSDTAPLLKSLAEKATPATLDHDVAPKPPTLLVSIDQGEELFLAEGQVRRGPSSHCCVTCLSKTRPPSVPYSQSAPTITNACNLPKSSKVCASKRSAS